MLKTFARTQLCAFRCYFPGIDNPIPSNDNLREERCPSPRERLRCHWSLSSDGTHLVCHWLLEEANLVGLPGNFSMRRAMPRLSVAQEGPPSLELLL
ncbi:hypothetical protein [Bradyrhizobium liaoningense]|uniref:hypothetical protein n=1 Tax=Bradyrhizobium liaoningense TaxID=43992 RepID=UPI001BADE3AE|nr:hypothetical protein [Bradyrhizobium liaoningense]MBR0906621.1 hypothetical protein [Bradyrhizobium liaoningense]